MARKTFFSFHYVPDNWRASQVRNMGILEGNPPASDNAWEQVTKGGDAAIERWIAGQMAGRTAAVVLIGSGTKGRKWIKHEIRKAWGDGLGVLGVYIHHLRDRNEQQSRKGGNPFDDFTLQKNGQTVSMSSVVKAYDPPFTVSTSAYAHIKNNLADWIDEAVTIRKNHKS